MGTRQGWLSLAERDRQAVAFAGWYTRRPTGGWRAAFAGWADGKDFDPWDRAAIERAVEARRLSTGVLVFTDPMEAA